MLRVRKCILDFWEVMLVSAENYAYIFSVKRLFSRDFARRYEGHTRRFIGRRIFFYLAIAQKSGLQIHNGGFYWETLRRRIEWPLNKRTRALNRLSDLVCVFKFLEVSRDGSWRKGLRPVMNETSGSGRLLWEWISSCGLEVWVSGRATAELA